MIALSFWLYQDMAMSLVWHALKGTLKNVSPAPYVLTQNGPLH